MELLVGCQNASVFDEQKLAICASAFFMRLEISSSLSIKSILYSDSRFNSLETELVFEIAMRCSFSFVFRETMLIPRFDVLWVIDSGSMSEKENDISERNQPPSTFNPRGDPITVVLTNDIEQPSNLMSSYFVDDGMFPDEISPPPYATNFSFIQSIVSWSEGLFFCKSCECEYFPSIAFVCLFCSADRVYKGNAININTIRVRIMV